MGLIPKISDISDAINPKFDELKAILEEMLTVLKEIDAKTKGSDGGTQQ